MDGAVLAGIRIYPVKALDPLPVDEAVVLESGALAGDRRLALVEPDGRFVNGKRCEAMHRLRARWEDGGRALLLTAPGEPERRFRLDEDLGPLADWASAWLGRPVRVTSDDERGFPDDTAAPGPTVVGRASLEEVCRWFPEVTLEGARRRFRANLELVGVPAFWEDRLFGAAGTVVRFRAGDVLLEGTNPCARCVVPPRDPDTGEAIAGFSRRFAERRAATLPRWAERSRFDHFYRLAVNTRVPPGQAGKRLRAGDPVRLEQPVAKTI